MLDNDETVHALRPAQPALDRLGVAELENYILALEAEIARAKAAADQKRKHREASDLFFRRP